MRLSHMLPIYQKTFVLYDTAIARVAGYIAKTKPGLVNIVDVGANVGDTASLILSTVENSRIICVEGNEAYLPLLHKNFDGCDSVIIEAVFCGESSSVESGLELDTKEGTASLIRSSENSKKIEFKTVDQIVTEQFSAQEGIDLLKVDTDGFDYKVLRGAIKTLKKYQPAVLFELDKHFLLMNEEQPMSVFSLFEDCGYSRFIAYDNTGYLIGLFHISEKENTERLIDYFYSRRLYMDILMIADESLIRTSYQNEQNATLSTVGLI